MTNALNIYLLENVFLITPPVLPASYMVAQPWVGNYHGEYQLTWNAPGAAMVNLWIDAAKKATLIRHLTNGEVRKLG